MTPCQLNPRVLSFLHAELLTTPADMERIARLGLLLVRSNDFLEAVAIQYGAEGVYVVNEFYRNFLGKYDLICVDRAPLGIRFCTQIDDGGQDGVQLVFTGHIAKLSRLAANFGTTTFTQLREYIV
jgi:hypothetical protein